MLFLVFLVENWRFPSHHLFLVGLFVMIERVSRQFNKSIIAGWLDFSHCVGAACIAKARAL